MCRVASHNTAAPSTAPNSVHLEHPVRIYLLGHAPQHQGKTDILQSGNRDMTERSGIGKKIGKWPGNDREKAWKWPGNGREEGQEPGN
jgi:hypothetical protein